IGIRRVADDLAVELQIRAGPAFLAPEPVLSERAVLRGEIFLPQLWRLDHVRVAVEHREVFRRHRALAGIRALTAGRPPPPASARRGSPLRSATNRGARSRRRARGCSVAEPA